MNKIDFNNMNIRHAAGEIFLIDAGLSDGSYHKPIIINEVGERIVLMLRDGMDIDHISSALAKEYDMPEGQMRSDVQDFIRSAEKGYVLW